MIKKTIKEYIDINLLSKYNEDEPLKFIAFDLSLKHLVIVLADSNNIYYKKKIILTRDRAGILFNNLQNITDEFDINLSSLDLLLSTIGPGNFNGIRISLSVIKGIAISNNIKIAGISSLEAISRSVSNHNNKFICSIIKASPGFYYIECFDQYNKSILKPNIINIEEGIMLPELDKDVILVGNDADYIADKINFKGELYNIESPSCESLFLSAKESIKNNIYKAVSPIYLREVNAKEPSLWKNPPTVINDK